MKSGTFPGESALLANSNGDAQRLSFMETELSVAYTRHQHMSQILLSWYITF